MLEKLKEVLRREDAVLFVGSGISAWSGLPMWNALLVMLAKWLDDHGRDGEVVRTEIERDLLQAASYGVDQLTPSETREFLRTALQFGSATPHQIHRALVSLGPSSFITTNYDQLIEDAYRKWRPGKLRVVTNRQPFETAEIVQARSTEFLFKIHGDLDDLSSIVLSREHYRKMVDGGELKHAAESLKTLLITRPVIYVGFSLRDPDFLLLRDVIANTWRGAARDHYAIVATASGAELQYWRKNYGIHLVAYDAAMAASGAVDHSSLLVLLRNLSKTKAIPSSPPPPSSKFEMLRYLQGLQAVRASDEEFPLEVVCRKGVAKNKVTGTSEFERWPVSRFLLRGPSRTVLVGAPGAGKSYSLRSAAAAIASVAENRLSTSRVRTAVLEIPVIVDMKLFDGDLVNLINQTFPPGIDFSSLYSQHKVRVFLDSFNEISREKITDSDPAAIVSAFTTKFPMVSLVVASRTAEVLASLDYPVYAIDAIDREFVRTHLERMNLSHSSKLEEDLIDVFERPFFFSLAKRGISLPVNPRPSDVYGAFVGGLAGRFTERFGPGFDLPRLLGSVAFEAISAGDEALSMQMWRTSLRRELQGGFGHVNADEVANWLVVQEVVVPIHGARAAFFHQAITEYLAGIELAARFTENNAYLDQQLQLQRWNHTVLLALSHLSEAEASSFLARVTEADLPLALDGVRFLEEDPFNALGRILERVPQYLEERENSFWRLPEALEKAPVQLRHVGELHRIAQGADLVGAVAAGLLFELSGMDVKQQMLGKIAAHAGDYNFGNYLGGCLTDFVDVRDLPWVIAAAEALVITPILPADRDGDKHDGFVCGVARALQNLPLSELSLLMDVPGDGSGLCRKVFLEVLRGRYAEDGLNYAAGLVLKGIDEAGTAFYFNAKFSPKRHQFTWRGINSRHVKAFIKFSLSGSNQSWCLGSLRLICAARPDLRKYVEQRIESLRGFEACLLGWACTGNQAAIFTYFKKLLTHGSTEYSVESLDSLGSLDLAWRGHEALYVDLLRTKRMEVVGPISRLVYAPVNSIMEELEIGPVRWWLDWFLRLEETEDGRWTLHQICSTFSQSLGADGRNEFVAEFNRGDSPYRKLLGERVLAARDDLSTDDFGIGAITFLLASLDDDFGDHSDGHVLGGAATERFIEDRLLPMLSVADGLRRKNLVAILLRAGERHGRRYVST